MGTKSTHKKQTNNQKKTTKKTKTVFGLSFITLRLEIGSPKWSIERWEKKSASVKVPVASEMRYSRLMNTMFSLLLPAVLHFSSSPPHFLKKIYKTLVLLKSSQRGYMKGNDTLCQGSSSYRKKIEAIWANFGEKTNNKGKQSSAYINLGADMSGGKKTFSPQILEEVGFLKSYAYHPHASCLSLWLTQFYPLFCPSWLQLSPFCLSTDVVLIGQNKNKISCQPTVSFLQRQKRI